jgi:hypothetical protein
MSSKLTQLAWNYTTHNIEDKLLLLALAELADNKGNFIASFAELGALTSISDSVLRARLQHFKRSDLGLITLNRNESTHDQLCGVLHLEPRVTPVKQAESQLDLINLARQQHERLSQNKPQSNAKLNRNQRAQISPLDNKANEKQFSVLQIHMQEIPDWAEGIMFKQGVHNRKEIWDSLVVDVHATGEKVFSLSQLTSRLYQKIHYFKDLAFSRVSSQASNPPVKQSALSVFEEKVMNYLSEDDDQHQ